MGNFWASIIAWAFPPQPVAGEIYVEEKQPTGVETYLTRVCKETDND